jgi:hypothetical protein
MFFLQEFTKFHSQILQRNCYSPSSVDHQRNIAMRVLVICWRERINHSDFTPEQEIGVKTLDIEECPTFDQTFFIADEPHRRYRCVRVEWGPLAMDRAYEYGAIVYAVYARVDGVAIAS